MKYDDFKEILAKCFGKEKDEKYHAIAMLILYAIFILIVVVIIRIGSSTTNNEINNNMEPTPTPTLTPSSTFDVDDQEDNSVEMNDINYSYSYTITYNGITEVYLGKKIDEKEKFTLVKDGMTTDYAILNDNYLILDNGIYKITENPSLLFKYCNVEELMLLTENEITTESETTIKYNISNDDIAKRFKETLVNDNEKNNSVTFNMLNDNLKSIDLDFSNYISSLEGNQSTLTIHMEFVDVGTTEDFEIKVS